MIRSRIIAAAEAVLTIAAGLLIRASFDGAVAKYAGDLLYTLSLYALIIVVAPRTRPVWAALVALGMSWLIEFAQLTGIPAELAARSVIARLVLGSTFNPPDLFWYVAGAFTGWAFHASVTAIRAQRN
jgi:hypothetical protein